MAPKPSIETRGGLARKKVEKKVRVSEAFQDAAAMKVEADSFSFLSLDGDFSDPVSGASRSSQMRVILCLIVCR